MSAARRCLLTCDIGNTRAKSGLFSLTDHEPPEVIATTAVEHASTSDHAAALTSWLRQQEQHPEEILISGSNPPVRDELLNCWPVGLPQPRLIDSADQIPLNIDVENPTRVGIDRLLTALAASRTFCPGQTTVVVDSGTATTINLVDADGIFRGGVILPGMRLSARALHDYTARLPLLDMDLLDETDKPELPGRNTEDAIRGGLFWGQVGAVREIRRRMTDNAGQEPACLVTGGGGRRMAPVLQPCDFVDCLTLHGLALLAKTPAE